MTRVPLRDNLGLVLRELRGRPEIRALPRLEWIVFIAIAIHWQRHDEAWPSQESIAAFCGYTVRVVPGAIGQLQRCGLLRLRRRRPESVPANIVYTPGPTLRTALAALEARYPRRDEAPATSSGPPETSSGGYRKPVPANWLTNKEPVVVKGAPSPIPPLPPEQQQQQQASECTDENRELAVLALTEHFQRRHPGLPPPRSFDAQDVQTVGRCAAAVPGDRDAKLQTLRDAVEGAFRASRRAPTVRFVWGRLEHFFEHADRGQRLRTAPAPRRAATASAPAPTEGIPRAQLEADLVKIFGPRWKSARGPR